MLVIKIITYGCYSLDTEVPFDDFYRFRRVFESSKMEPCDGNFIYFFVGNYVIILNVKKTLSYLTFFSPYFRETFFSWSLKCKAPPVSRVAVSGVKSRGKARNFYHPYHGEGEWIGYPVPYSKESFLKRNTTCLQAKNWKPLLFSLLKNSYWRLRIYLKLDSVIIFN